MGRFAAMNDSRVTKFGKFLENPELMKSQFSIFLKEIWRLSGLVPNVLIEIMVLMPSMTLDMLLSQD
jgi:hypothetical protein